MNMGGQPTEEDVQEWRDDTDSSIKAMLEPEDEKVAIDIETWPYSHLFDVDYAELELRRISELLRSYIVPGAIESVTIRDVVEVGPPKPVAAPAPAPVARKERVCKAPGCRKVCDVGLPCWACGNE